MRLEMQMFIGTAFITDKNKNNPVSSPGEEINKIWHIHTVKCYLSMQKTSTYKSIDKTC